jgi:AcrR family transcriptional regulator
MRLYNSANMKKKRTGPGRPEGESVAREKILGAAEAAFAEDGYWGTSLRQIVERAHVTQALVTYYFGSKDALFKEVFLKRGREIAAARLAALNTLPAKPTLEQVIAAYLKPALDMRATREGRAFIRLQARMHTEPPRFAESLRREVYDEMVRRYVAAIRKAAPHLSVRTAYWRMALVIGAYLYVHSDAHRLEELSEGACTTDDLDEMLQQITAFVVGGLMAPDRGAVRKRLGET